MTQITISVNPDDEEDVQRGFEALKRLVPSAAPEPAKAMTAAEKKAAKARDKAAEEKAAEEVAEPEVEESASEFSIDDVRAALKDFASLNSKEEAIQILKDHGSNSIGELDVAKYADVMKAAE